MRNGTVTPASEGEVMDVAALEVLVLRAWAEPADGSRLRVRVVRVSPGEADRPVLTTTSVEETCAAVRDWLTQLLRQGAQSDP